MVDQSPDAIVRLDRHGRYTYVNEAFEQLVERSARDILGSSSIELGIPSEARPTWQRALHAAMDQGTIQTTEIPWKRGDKVYWYHLRLVPEHGSAAVDSVLVFAREVTALKVSQKALWKSQERYRLLFEQSRDAIVVCNLDGVPVDANRACAQLLGGNLHPFESRDAVSYYEYASDFERLRSLVLEHGCVDDFEVVMKRRDGSKIHCVITANLVFDATGKTLIQGIIRDVSEDKQAEEQLRQRSFELGQRVKELDCIYSVSRTFAKVHDADEALTRVARLLPAGWQYPEVAVARIVIGDNVYVSDEFRETPFTISEPIRIDDAVVGRVEVGYLDERPLAHEGPFLLEERQLLCRIAERIGDALGRRRAEAALARSERYYRSLIENSSDLVALVDKTGTVAYANQAVRDALEREPEDVVGTDALSWVHPDDRKRLLRHLVCKGEGVLLHCGRLRIAQGTGSFRDFEVTVRDQTDDPDVGGIIVSLRDVTDRIRLEDQLRRVQKMEAIGRLAGGVAHDFNNLLTVIQANATFLSNDLLSELREGADYSDALYQIQHAARKGGEVTRRLLAFSRRQPLKPAVVNVQAVLWDLEGMLKRLIGEDIDLFVGTEGSAGSARFDPGQLDQVLMNLVVNARDAMPRGGRLVVAATSVTLSSEEAERRGGAGAGDYVLISVSDTGSGMTEGVRERAFEPFFTTKPQGNGLGLASVYGTVAQSGGFVDVESEVGQGTTIRIYLPSEREETVTPKAAQPAPAGGNETILLVEDEASVRAVARRTLQRQGYQVLEAASAAEGLQLATDHQGSIDLLLTDVVMPEMGGGELVAQFRNVCPDARVLFMSGYPDDSLALHGVSTAEAAFVAKPFEPSDLEGAVRQELDRDRSRE